MRKGDRIRESAKTMAWRWGIFFSCFAVVVGTIYLSTCVPKYDTCSRPAAK